MKHIVTMIALCIFSNATAQKYFTKTGSTDFKASVAAFEPVEATNNSTTVILDTSNGNMAALLFLKAFHFEIALMQEHFNENYMDSDKFPKAKFKGSIHNFSINDVTEEIKQFKLKGIVSIRGKNKEISTDATLYKEGKKIILKAQFNVQPQDFDISIPSIVRKKIAESININLHYELLEKK